MNAIVQVAPDQLLTVSDVAQLWQCSKSWIYKEVDAGRLPCIRIGSMIRFSAEALKRVAATQT